MTVGDEDVAGVGCYKHALYIRWLVGLFKVIKTGNNWKPVCNFLLVLLFHICALSFLSYKDLLAESWNRPFYAVLPTPFSFEALVRGVPLWSMCVKVGPK